MRNFLSLNLLFLIFGTYANAYPVLWQVGTGQTQEVRAFGVCKRVLNNVSPSATITIDTYTSGNWSSYVASPPTGVTISDCPVTSPSYINLQYANSSGSTSCTVTKPVGLAVGDLMITTMYEGSDISTLTAPSGFTLIHGPYTIGSSAYREVRHYKIATSGDVAASNFSYTRPTNFSDCGITIAAFRNVNQTTPIAGHAWNNSTSTATVTFLSVTATTAGSLSIAISESTDISTPANPSGYSDIMEIVPQYLRWSMKVLTSSGATGNFTTTMGAPGTSATSHIVINPM